MAQAFTRNFTDHSNNSGFQFEFHCDKCGNGYRSSFKTSSLGMAASFLKAAGSLFGGDVANAGWGADHVKDAFRGGDWDAAFKEANDEVRGKFHLCQRCGRWVCPTACWNPQRSLCKECAPDLQVEAASIQSHVAVEQMWEKARAGDQTQGANFQSTQMGACPRCNNRLEPNARFCVGCGLNLQAQAKPFCAQCGNQITPGSRFCAGCGAPAAG